MPRVAVWDLPVRVFHWALAGLVVFSYVTAKIGGTWMEWHLRSGYAILALLLFRLAWGLFGSPTARFSGFVRGPRHAFDYAKATLARRHPVVVGHNPLGGWMVLLMLAILLTQAVTGLFADDEIATQGPLAAKVSNALVGRMSAIHSFNQWAIVAAVALHVIAIAVYQFVLKVNLVAPMIHGSMEAPAALRPARAGASALAAVLLALAGGFVYWLVMVYPRSPS